MSSNGEVEVDVWTPQRYNFAFNCIEGAPRPIKGDMEAQAAIALLYRKGYSVTLIPNVEKEKRSDR